MSAEKDPPIMLPLPEVGFCQRHLEPLRADWPKGYGLLALFAFQSVMAEDRFTDRFPKNAAGLIEVDNARISAELVAVSPLCCFLGDIVIDGLMKRAINPEKGAQS